MGSRKGKEPAHATKCVFRGVDQPSDDISGVSSPPYETPVHTSSSNLSTRNLSTGEQKWVYTLQTEEDDVLPDTFAEEDLKGASTRAKV